MDFDWCGKVGEVFYPPNLSREIAWPEDVDPSAEIKIEHDEVQFKDRSGTAIGS